MDHLSYCCLESKVTENATTRNSENPCTVGSEALNDGVHSFSNLHEHTHIDRRCINDAAEKKNDERQKRISFLCRFYNLEKSII